MNKKYGIAAIIAGVIIVGVLVFTYGNNANTNSVGKNQQSNASNSTGQNQQSNASNSITVPTPANTTGKHFFAGVNETVTITTK